MNNLITVIQVIAGLFSIYGLCEFVRRFIDMYVICKSGAVCKITLHTPGDDPEYTVRFLESRFLSGDYADLFDCIEIPKNVGVDCNTIENLKDEFRNISLK